MPKAINNMKKCCRCKKIKSVTEFHKCKSKLDGLDYSCKECKNYQSLKFKANNRDHIKELNKVYYYKDIEKSRESCKERMRKYRKAHPGMTEKWREDAREWARTNKDHKNIQRKIWRNETISGLISVRKMNQKRRENSNKVVNTLTENDIRFLLYLQNNECARCGISFSVKRFTLDHIIPLSKGGGLTLENTQLLCRSCNSSKHDKIEIHRPNINFYCLSFI